MTHESADNRHCLCCPAPAAAFKPLLPGCARYHDPIPDLGYMAAVDDAETRMAAGETQIVYPCCCKYVWLSFFHHLGTTVVEKVGRTNFASPGPDVVNPKYKPLRAERGAD